MHGRQYYQWLEVNPVLVSVLFGKQNGFSGSLFGAHLPTTATVAFSGPEISPPFETTSFDKVDMSAFVSDPHGTKKNR